MATATSKIVFLEPTDSEMATAWKNLVRARSDTLLGRGNALCELAGTRECPGDSCPVAQEDGPSGEVWQYMGTVPRERHEIIGSLSRGIIRIEWVHQFRHRMHPIQRRRVYMNIPTSNGWNPS